MQLNKNSNVLLITGLYLESDKSLHDNLNISSDNIYVLNSFGPEIALPYGDLMRDIITAVYQKDISEIYLVGGKERVKDDGDENSFDKVLQKGQKAEYIQTLDYIFQYYLTDGTLGNISKWLEGNRTVEEDIQKDIAFIRNHPFLPAGLKVQGFLVSEEGQLKEIFSLEEQEDKNHSI